RMVYTAIIFFFFQAEDGIRDFHVTGVQTCALPICCNGRRGCSGNFRPSSSSCSGTPSIAPSGADRTWACSRCGDCEPAQLGTLRSEERRVGEERQYRGEPIQNKRSSKG